MKAKCCVPGCHDESYGYCEACNRPSCFEHGFYGVPQVGADGGWFCQPPHPPHTTPEDCWPSTFNVDLDEWNFYYTDVALRAADWESLSALVDQWDPTTSTRGGV